MHYSSQHASSTPYHFIRSYAKINLTLDVLGRRSDGYHELATVMQTVDLYDTICLSHSSSSAIHISCTQSALANSDNLCVRAAQAVLNHLSLTQGLTIELHKRVPTAAGLGGGSSNAASILLALRTWWHLPLSDEDLHDIAASLGSDIPFFLTGGLALCKGRGELINPLPPSQSDSLRWLLLLKPAISVSTPSVFRSLPSTDYSDGSHTLSLCTSLLSHSNPADEHFHNGLERNVLATYPAVSHARSALLSAGASLVRLSGSGPTLFSPFSNLTDAYQTYQTLQAQGFEVYLTQPIHPANVHDNRNL